MLVGLFFFIASEIFPTLSDLSLVTSLREWESVDTKQWPQLIGSSGLSYHVCHEGHNHKQGLYIHISQKKDTLDRVKDPGQQGLSETSLSRSTALNAQEKEM